MSRGNTRRWMKGGYEHELRIVVECLADSNHSKVLRFDAALGMENANIIAAVLDGSSRHYIIKPGPNSPLGKCSTCGGQLKTTLEERHNDARYLDQVDKHLKHPHQGHA